MVEVLVALVILAVGLGAAIRAAVAVTTTSEHLNAVLLAFISAENTLGEVRLTEQWPVIATTRKRCDQGKTELACERVVSATANTNIRSVTVNVFKVQNGSGDSGGKLATVVGIIINNEVL